MSFKFKVGERVDYEPIGQNAGQFIVVRHMPIEDGTSDRRYVIKSVGESFERNVNEIDLLTVSPDAAVEPYAPKPKRLFSRK